MAAICMVVERTTAEEAKRFDGFQPAKRDYADIEQAFSLLWRELGVLSRTEFRFIVAGTAQTLRTKILDEVYLIGYEALSNALSHSQATQVEVEVEYPRSHLRVAIRDNGIGISTDVLRRRGEGQWGLSAMKERAQRIGGECKVLSRVGAGTEVQLTIPARIALELGSQGYRPGWVARFYPAKNHGETYHLPGS